jgi:hypothetical protein
VTVSPARIVARLPSYWSAQRAQQPYPLGHKPPATTARYMRPQKDAAAEVLRAAVIHNLSPDSGAILVEETEEPAPNPTDSIPPDEILNDYFPVRGGGLEPPWLLTASTSS